MPPEPVRAVFGALEHSTPESAKVPARVLDHVRSIVNDLRDMRLRLDETINNLDARLRGNGRYEWEFLLGHVGSLGRSVAMLEQFCALAPGNGVDGAKVIQELGGVPSFLPSEKSRAWFREQDGGTLSLLAEFSQRAAGLGCAHSGANASTVSDALADGDAEQDRADGGPAVDRPTQSS